MKAEGWAIKGVYGFYMGWWQTREEAMRAHCRDLAESWGYCRKKGDRAVRVCIKELPAKKKSKAVICARYDVSCLLDNVDGVSCHLNCKQYAPRKRK